MIVVGGLYRERCISPEWNHLYGSGGRAAAALAGQVQNVDSSPIASHPFKSVPPY